MRSALVVLPLLTAAVPLAGQAAGKFPPDSLVNTKVIPHDTPVMQVVGTMRNFAISLGVRCHFCHAGEEGKPLSEYDFPNDDKRTKQVARQMMRMVAEINRRLDTIPSRPDPGVEVTCRTCHRGVSRPVPLATIVAEATVAGGADSGTRVYHDLREKYFGRDAYNFGEESLNIAAFRTAQQKRPEDALKLLTLNEAQFPQSSGLSVFRGNILLMQGDTAAAAAAFREAIRRDPHNGEARGRLRDIGERP
jgi:tetratricopeptide (TPR) repeat protein